MSGIQLVIACPKLWQTRTILYGNKLRGVSLAKRRVCGMSIGP